VPFEKIKLQQNDSDLVRFGNGTGGSRSITATGKAIVESSSLVIAKGKQAAAHLMEASEADIEFTDGRFSIAGTDRSMDIMELARRMRDEKMPEDVPSSLDVDHNTTETPSTFPNGCHVAEVEIDPETGVIRIVRYTGINDFGTIVNPMIVDGQLHGGVAQGIGQALMEEVSYDESGPDHLGASYKYSGSVSLDGDGKGTSSAVNIKVIRLSEVYLIAAEAAFHSDKSLAADYLNAIRKRAPDLAPADASTITLQMILDERSKELFSEGDRFFDMMRLNQSITYNDDFGGIAVSQREKTIDRTFYKTVLPISQSEINANPELKAQQNDGY